MIKNLYDLYNQKSESFIRNLMNGHVRIDDDINGSFFSAKRDEDGKWIYFKRNGKISDIDRTISKFYEQAISVFENMPADRIANIPTNLVFNFKYVPSAQGGDVISKNILKITHIYDMANNSNINELETLNKWSEYLMVGNPPVIFDGMLDDTQKDGIMQFLYTNQKELAKRFSSESFTEYLISLLNPGYKSEGIDSIVFRFTDDNNEQVLAKYIDPLFYDIASQKKVQEVTSQNDTAYILIIQIMNFIESYQISELMSVVREDAPYEKNYTALINKVFIDYINLNYADMIDYQIFVPEYLKESEEVLTLIRISKNFKEIYRLMLNFFKKKRKKSNSIFTEDICVIFNKLIDKLQKIVLGKSIYEKYYPTFSEYYSPLSEEFNFQATRFMDPMERFESHAKRKAINIIVDYCQPISNKHLETAKTLKGKNKLDTLLIIIDNKSKSYIRPFSTQTAQNLVSKIISRGNSPIIASIVINNNNIDSMLKAICKDYIPVLWAASKSKIEEYTLEMEYAKKRSTKYNVSKKFRLIIAPEMLDTRIIDFIRTENYQEFKKSVPETIHSEFFNLVKEAKLTEDK